MSDPKRTTYVVLRKTTVRQEADAWVEVSRVESYSREAALLVVWAGLVETAQRAPGDELETLLATEPELVAVPASSWRPEQPKAKVDLKLSL